MEVCLNKLEAQRACIPQLDVWAIMGKCSKEKFAKNSTSGVFYVEECSTVNDLDYLICTKNGVKWVKIQGGYLAAILFVDQC